MTFTDFCEKMLIALYQDGSASDELLSFAELQEKYGLEGDVSWLSRSMNHLRNQRRVEGREIPGAPDTVVGKITGSGMAYIEGKYGGKDGVGQVLEPASRGSTLDQFFEDSDERARQPVFDPNIFDPEIFDTGNQPPGSATIHSEAWTGISSIRIDARNAQAVSRLIDAALKELPRDDNVSVAQARTLLLAAKELTDAPEPPSDIIWELVQRAGAVVGLLDIFIRIFLGLTH